MNTLHRIFILFVGTLSSLSIWSQPAQLEVGKGQYGNVIFYHGPLPLPSNTQLIRTDANGTEKSFPFAMAGSLKEINRHIETTPPVFNYLLGLNETSSEKLWESIQAVSSTEAIPLFNITSVALATGLALTDPEGNLSHSYRLRTNATWLTEAAKPNNKPERWLKYRPVALGQSTQEENVRLGWYVPAESRDFLLGVVAYRSKPFQESFETIATLRGFQEQGDSLIATMRDTTTHIQGSWHYAIRMIDRFGAPSGISELILAHNYPPGSRPYFNTFKATGRSDKPAIELSWTLGNSVRVRSIQIYRSRNFDGPFQQVHACDAGTTDWVDYIQEPMEAYFYHLKIEDVAGDTTIRTVTYPAVSEYQPPALPVNEIACDTVGRSIRIRWTGNPPNDRGYYVMRAEGYDESQLIVISSFIPADRMKSEYEYTDTDSTLRGDRYYTYVVISESHGYLKSGYVVTATARPTIPLFVPSPTRCSIRLEDDGVRATITWGHVVSDTYTNHLGYKVYSRAKETTDPFRELTPEMILLDTNWHTFAPANPADEYVVRAFDLFGNKSAFSVAARLDTTFIHDFGPRYIRSEPLGNDQITLRWNNPATQRAKSYTLYLTNGEDEPVVVGKFTQTELSHTVRLPAAGAVHYYFIVALDENQVPSSPSEWVTVHR